eukprot:TRINITY_DN3121_c4_g6_i1.p1 TRINITY_DN3121_c4_g6~~TRINITY_DN3121_c4_g6_i1.p1  ORF type:complete len:549 (+),score=126.44 TRINITY_DN3121_c4_g6_i1:28-1647(+)
MVPVNEKYKAESAIVSAVVREYMKNKSIDNYLNLRSSILEKLGIDYIPKTSDIIAALPSEYRDSIGPLLRVKPIRTASGVAVVAVMCKPHRCPHVEETGFPCLYCPGGPDSDFEYSSQSYTGFEPTSMRAIAARYDPYVQAKHRLKQLEKLGHPIDKVEYVLMGGTFLCLPKKYRDWFVIRMHDALSGHSSATVEESIKFSQFGPHKCVAITMETRPDYCHPEHLDNMLSYGVTRLEIGMQSVFDDVMLFVGRGHGVDEVNRSLEWSKQAGYKIILHMMPNLPTVPLFRERACFKQLFYNPMFRPDGLKLYPTLVMRGTKLYDMWEKGEFKSFEPEQLVDLLADILCDMAPWARVYRVQRDIPLPLVTSGAEFGNMRQLAMERAEEKKGRILDIRAREVGMSKIHRKIQPHQVELVRRDYVGQKGWETFLSYEDPTNDILIGMLRLRYIEGKHWRDEFQEPTSMIRELHVYGSVVSVHSKDFSLWQHKGYGQLLIEEAEKIAREEHGTTELFVISGVGTRQYYSKYGFKLKGPYMAKDI